MTTQAAPKSKKPSKISSSLSLSHGFGPGYFEEESTVNYSSASIRVNYKVNSKVFVGISQSVTQVTEPALEVKASDPALTISIPKIAKILGTKTTLGSSLRASPGISKNSLEKDKYGSAAVTSTISRPFGKLRVGSSVSLSQNFYKWTFNSKGSRNVNRVYSVRGSSSVQLSKKIGASLSLSYSKIDWYEGTASYTYENYAGMSLATTKNSSMSIGISTSDSQLRADGKNNNELALYQRSKTELFVSANYTL